VGELVSWNRWLGLLIAWPLLVLLAANVGLLGLSVAKRPLFWYPETVTLSEAAALSDGGEVARQLAGGADPNRAYPVRRGIVRGRRMATPLQAARSAGRQEIVDLLRAAGAR
jgi:hypothetical protein